MAEIRINPILPEKSQLTSANYDVWARSMKTIIHHMGYKDVVYLGIDENIVSRSAEKSEEAADILVQNLSEELHPRFVKELDAKSIWDTLEKMYADTNAFEITSILCEMLSLKMTSFDDYIIKQNALEVKLAALNMSLVEASRYVTLMNSPVRYNSAVQAVLGSTTCLERLDKYRGQFQLAEGRLEEPTPKVALATPSGCIICDMHNHTTEDCYHLKQLKSKKKGKKPITKQPETFYMEE
ncbi:hypothetical protein H4R20_001051, partial [Coemansia guatemalensis]